MPVTIENALTVHPLTLTREANGNLAEGRYSLDELRARLEAPDADEAALLAIAAKRGEAYFKQGESYLSFAPTADDTETLPGGADADPDADPEDDDPDAEPEDDQEDEPDADQEDEPESAPDADQEDEPESAPDADQEDEPESDEEPYEGEDDGESDEDESMTF